MGDGMGTGCLLSCWCLQCLQCWQSGQLLAGDEVLTTLDACPECPPFPYCDARWLRLQRKGERPSQGSAVSSPTLVGAPWVFLRPRPMQAEPHSWSPFGCMLFPGAPAACSTLDRRVDVFPAWGCDMSVAPCEAVSASVEGQHRGVVGWEGHCSQPRDKHAVALFPPGRQVNSPCYFLSSHREGCSSCSRAGCWV